MKRSQWSFAHTVLHPVQLLTRYSHRTPPHALGPSNLFSLAFVSHHQPSVVCVLLLSLLTLSFIIYIFFSSLLFLKLLLSQWSTAPRVSRPWRLRLLGCFVYTPPSSAVCARHIPPSFLSLLPVLCLQCLYFCISGVHCDKSANLLLSMKSFCSPIKKICQQDGTFYAVSNIVFWYL